MKAKEIFSITVFMKNLFHGKFLSEVKNVKNLPLLLYITFWVLLVIHLSNNSDKKALIVYKLQKEVNDLNIRSTAIKAQLLEESKYSRIKEKAASLNLYQDRIPPKKIIIQ